jgi:hypothetical protein
MRCLSRLFIPVALASAIVAATACGPSITITRDAALPIRAGATYAWGAADGRPTGAELDPRVSSDSVQRRIRTAIDDVLQARGFSPAPADRANVIVHFHVGVRSKIDTIANPAVRPCTSTPCPQGKFDWGYYGAPERAVQEVEYTEGSLMIDFLSRPSMQLAWRVVGVGDAKEQGVSDAQLREGVAQLLKKFPND